MLFFLRLKWGILKNICIFALIFTPYFPEKDSEGVGDILRISVLQRFVFGCLNLGNSNVKSKTSQSGCFGWYITSRCVQRVRATLTHTLTGVEHISRRERHNSVCLLNRLS